MKRVLITGANGLLGREICRSFSGKYNIIPTDLRELDVLNGKDCVGAIVGCQPDIVIHCVGYTAVDRAEKDAENARKLNVGGSRNIALACRKYGVLLVTFGTDYVFDGTASLPYSEEDPTNPLSVYGCSKLEEEKAIREIGPPHLLVRTQWLFGPHGRNFVLSILDKAGRGEELNVVSDQIGSPTYTKDLAEAVMNLLNVGASGTFHFSNEGETTFYDFAYFILKHKWVDGLLNLSPVATSDLPKGSYPAPRPSYAVLSKEKYRSVTCKTPRRWEYAVLEFLNIHKEAR